MKHIQLLHENVSISMDDKLNIGSGFFSFFRSVALMRHTNLNYERQSGDEHNFTKEALASVYNTLRGLTCEQLFRI